jgi:hypothetical protein|tara:strand:- start:1645 stop:2181 length:537 start_codon:yes stop_codon:yes gene_type:complete
MSEAEQEWMGSLMRPSSTLSAGSFIVGVWMAFLTLVNIVFGAYSSGRRVNWIDFLTNGDETNSVHEIALSFPDDILFVMLSSLLIAAGVMGMGSAREDGFRGWLTGLPRDRVFTSLFSTKEGLGRTFSSWMIVSGAAYYLLWSTLESTWVDPGVYSVMISFVMVGVGLNWVQDAKLDN